MKVPFLDLRRSHRFMSDQLEQVFQRILEESYFSHGKDVAQFEQQFALLHDVPFAISTGNCTDALFLTLKALGISEYDQVIVPAMTWITDAEVVSNLGAKPVFVDVTEEGLIDVAQIEKSINNFTKAIIPVHLYGQMADMNAIMELADEHKLKVIEDCAQSAFAKQHNKLAGTYGHASVFSFYPTKNLGALGDAGCVLTKDQDLAEKVRKLANHGGLTQHDHEFPGYNSRMDTLQAAVLSLKLNFVQKWNAERNAIADFYNDQLGVLPLKLPSRAWGDTHVFHIYQIQTNRRDELKAFLKENGVATKVHYPKAIPFTKAYAHEQAIPEMYPNAYRIQTESLSLPIFPGMNEQELRHIVETIKKFFK